MNNWIINYNTVPVRLIPVAHPVPLFSLWAVWLSPLHTRVNLAILNNTILVITFYVQPSRTWNHWTSPWMKQLTWLRIIHSGEWCLRLALRTHSGDWQKWMNEWVCTVRLLRLFLFVALSVSDLIPEKDTSTVEGTFRAPYPPRRSNIGRSPLSQSTG